MNQIFDFEKITVKTICFKNKAVCTASFSISFLPLTKGLSIFLSTHSSRTNLLGMSCILCVLNNAHHRQNLLQKLFYLLSYSIKFKVDLLPVSFLCVS